MERYNWSRLAVADVVKLSQDIFYEDMTIKDSLRRGLWMHLLRIFHPSLAKSQEREVYIEKLRRVYDSLKGKWRSNCTPQVHSLWDNVRRDAIRTDPTEEFYHQDSNVEKLTNITVIYTLEHPGVSYTQGMTDLLSPLLFIMEREDDSYICFAAMLERLKGNFSSWCDGALKKVERLRHLCEVLQPELFHYLTENIQEDVFALFFGMILIDCRREVTFKDSFHLYEVLMASAITTAEATDISLSEWAGFMARESPDIIKVVFGEEAGPYSAQPLSRSDSSELLISEVHVPSQITPPNEQRTSGDNSGSGGGLDSEQLRRQLSQTLERPPLVPLPVAISSTEVRHCTTSEMSEISSLESSPVPKPFQGGELLTSTEYRPGSCGIPIQQQVPFTCTKSASESALRGLHSDFGGMRIPGSAGNSGHLFSYPVQSSFTKGGVHLPHLSPPRDHLLTAAVDNPVPVGSHNVGLGPRTINIKDCSVGTGLVSVHDISQGVISRLVSTEQAVPNVTRLSSLTVAIQDCFSLFICLSLLVQNRATIFRRQLDFIGLSMLLNQQGGTQDLAKTLALARDLLFEYQKYQNWYGRPNGWLDDIAGDETDA